LIEHDLFGKPVSTPHQVWGRLFRIMLWERGRAIEQPAITRCVHLCEATIQSTFTSIALILASVAVNRRSPVRRKRVSENFEEVEMNGTKVLGLAAIGALLVVAAPVERASAVSLINPGAAQAVQGNWKQLTTEVHWHHRHWGWRHRWHHRHWGWRHRWHHRHWW